MCEEAAAVNITLLMRQQAVPYGGLLEGNLSAAFEFVRNVGRPNLCMALATSAMAVPDNGRAAILHCRSCSYGDSRYTIENGA
jgi:hypothetical protein